MHDHGNTKPEHSYGLEAFIRVNLFTYNNLQLITILVELELTNSIFFGSKIFDVFVIWFQFWSDKKSNLKLKVQTAGGDPSSLLSNIEWRIWDNFLSKHGVRRPCKFPNSHFLSLCNLSPKSADKFNVLS